MTSPTRSFEPSTLADTTAASVQLNYMHAGESIEPADYPSLCDYLDRVFARPIFAHRIEDDLASLSGLSTAGS